MSQRLVINAQFYSDLAAHNNSSTWKKCYTITSNHKKTNYYLLQHYTTTSTSEHLRETDLRRRSSHQRVFSAAMTFSWVSVFLTAADDAIISLGDFFLVDCSSFTIFGLAWTGAGVELTIEAGSPNDEIGDGWNCSTSSSTSFWIRRTMLAGSTALDAVAVDGAFTVDCRVSTTLVVMDGWFSVAYAHFLSTAKEYDCDTIRTHFRVLHVTGKKNYRASNSFGIRLFSVNSRIQAVSKATLSTTKNM